MCDLGRKAFIMHEEKIYFSNVVDEEPFKAIWKQVPRLSSGMNATNAIAMRREEYLLVASITNLDDR